MELTVIFKRIAFLFLLFSCLCLKAQQDSIINSELSFEEQSLLDSMQKEYSDTLKKDTVFYEKFIPYDYKIYNNSKKNIRKSLISDLKHNFRKNLNNQNIFILVIFCLLLVIFFKNQFQFQYHLITKSLFSRIAFNEFMETQTAVFKTSKLLTWIISVFSLSIGVLIIIEQKEIFNQTNDFLLFLMIVGVISAIFILNQILKMLFSYGFNQPILKNEYAFIFRINTFISSLIVLPIYLVGYYYLPEFFKTFLPVLILLTIVLNYVFSILKFLLSGMFSKNDSVLILILYLCSFEILPLMILITSSNKFLGT